jgi:hypothetical protein
MAFRKADIRAADDEREMDRGRLKRKCSQHFHMAAAGRHEMPPVRGSAAPRRPHASMHMATPADGHRTVHPPQLAI